MVRIRSQTFTSRLINWPVSILQGPAGVTGPRGAAAIGRLIREVRIGSGNVAVDYNAKVGQPMTFDIARAG